MKTITNLSTKIQEVQRIREEIQTAITNLPDNPDIKRISSNCFVMSSSQIFSNPKNPTKRMDVFFHNFKKQYEKIAEVIDSCYSENIISILENIVKSGYLNHSGRHYNFHPDVIANLSNILGIA
jgi:hypothetical protein